MYNKKKIIVLLTITLFSAILFGKSIDFQKMKNKTYAVNSVMIEVKF